MALIRRKDIDMTQGPLLGKMLMFAIPLMLTNFLQAFYNAADMIVVGLSSEGDAVGAIGTTSAFTALILHLLIGIAVGANVVVAQCCGAGDYRQTGEAVHTSIALSMVGGVCVGVLGFFLAGFFLSLMSTPAEVLPLATAYMRVYFLGMPANML